MFKACATQDCLRTGLRVLPGAAVTPRKKNPILKEIINVGRFLCSF